jgi:type IV pilus assembly protein PilB
MHGVSHADRRPPHAGGGSARVSRPACRDPRPKPPEHVAGKTFYYGKGCQNCNNTGYRGRLGLYEIMLLDDEMRDQIIKHASTQQLRKMCKERGVRNLRECGLMAIFDGITTIEEVLKYT